MKARPGLSVSKCRGLMSTHRSLLFWQMLFQTARFSPSVQTAEVHPYAVTFWTDYV